MCGITGFWNFENAPIDKKEFNAFTDSLAHRGPDGRGTWYDENVALALGHRRLAILDISSRGAQPMTYADGRYVITFNGEIFNYLEIRQELKQKGYVFQSTSDTETILAAWQEWGEECQYKFNGMWAFGLWDKSTKQLFLSRDRFGVKPLHIIWKKHFFGFASELKAFAACPYVQPEIDERILAEHMVHINGLEGSPSTILKGIQHLPAGHSMVVSAGKKPLVKKWWNTADHIPLLSTTPHEEQFLSLLQDACKIRLRSDVSVATSLSGGLDSSSIALVVAQLLRDVDAQQKVFIAHFPNTNQDELSYAREIAQTANITPIIESMDENSSLFDIEKLIWQQEDVYWVPLIGPSRIYESMRRNNVVVTLDGHGADELLGGYHFQVLYAMLRSLLPFPHTKRMHDLRGILAGLSGGSVSHIPSSLPMQLYQGFHTTFFATALMKQIYRFTTPSFLLQPISNPRLLYEHQDASTNAMEPFNRYLYAKFHQTVLPTILRNFDRASMAHGIEVRMPFMDWRLVTFAFSLRGQEKIGEGYTKHILRKSMKGILPESVRLRTNKIGFTSPTDAWLRGSLHEWMMDTVTSTDFRQSSIWDGKKIEAYIQSGKPLEAIWPYLNAYHLIKSWSNL